MVLLASLFLILLAAGYVAVKKEIPYARVFLGVVALAGILAAGIDRWHQATSSPAARALADEEAAGLALGRTFAGEIKSGSILVLRAAPKKGFNDITLTRFNGLRSALDKSSLQLLQGGPDRHNRGTDEQDFTIFSFENMAEEIQKWCAAHPDVKAIVSLMPVAPDLRGMHVPPFYGFFAGRGMPWVDGLRNGSIKAAVLYRSQPLQPETRPEQNSGLPPKFILVTAANLDEVLKAVQGI